MEVVGGAGNGGLLRFVLGWFDILLLWWWELQQNAAQVPQQLWHKYMYLHGLRIVPVGCVIQYLPRVHALRQHNDTYV